MYAFNAQLMGVPPGVTDNKSQDIQDIILLQAYSRAVVPQVKKLNMASKPFSAEVYGEMSTELIDTILQDCNINSQSVVVDLGSGVGNVVTQSRIRTACTVFGIEQRELAAHTARCLLMEVNARSQMWGSTIANGMEVEQGDIRKSEQLRRWLREADLVICNNLMFDEDRESALPFLAQL